VFDWLIGVVIQLEKFFNYYDPDRPHQSNTSAYGRSTATPPW
jgi:hypothetical protein